jgi:3-methyladenine DNA glycosylase AlkD
MESYMKNKFPFLGVDATRRKEIVKIIIPKVKSLTLNDYLHLCLQLWDKSEREFQYVALDLLVKQAKKLETNHLHHIENLIINKSWWDTVDALSTSVVGIILIKNNDVKYEKFYQWVESENMWLNRTAILFQLKYKQNTDTNILSRAILQHDQSKDFFIRKAQGWALREYSKTNPLWVKNFISTQPNLSNLTIREASKYL